MTNIVAVIAIFGQTLLIVVIDQKTGIIGRLT